MRYLKFLYSYSYKSIKSYELFNSIGISFEQILKELYQCSKDKNCLKCIKEDKNCDIINYLISGEIQCLIGYSPKFNLIHFLWFIKSTAINLAPKLILLNELIDSKEVLEIIDFKKNFYFFITPFNNNLIQVFNKSQFNFSGLKEAIYDLNEEDVFELIYDKNVIYTMYKYKPLNLEKIHKYDNFFTIFFSSLKKEFMLEKIFLENSFDLNCLINFYSMFLKGTFSKSKIKQIFESIFNSKYLIFDFKFNTFSFQYIAKDKEDVKFFKHLHDKGLLSFSLSNSSRFNL
ncbi:MAG: hypothetical protein ACTSVV_18940 [Promethearchaeota archaeon]